jgi:hypothetical protein
MRFKLRVMLHLCVLGDNIRTVHVDRAFSLMPELLGMTSLLFSPTNAANLRNLSNEKVNSRVNFLMESLSDSLRRLLFSFSPSNNSMSIPPFIRT